MAASVGAKENINFIWGPHMKGKKGDSKFAELFRLKTEYFTFCGATKKLVGDPRGHPFSETYREARAKFLQLAKTTGAYIIVVDHDVESIDDELLTTDVAIYGDFDLESGRLNAERVFVITSGIHGVEAFSGSAVQLSLMEQIEYCGLDFRQGDALIIVHVLNPFGMAYLRRVGPDNEDPNRNCGEEKPVASELYHQVNDLINPQVPPGEDVNFKSEFSELLKKYDAHHLQQDLAFGQVTFPKGVSYCGEEPGILPKAIIPELAKVLEVAKKIVIVDLHSGYGSKLGYETLLSDNLPNSAEYKELKEVFGDRLYPMQKDEIGFAISGSFIAALMRMLSKAEASPKLHALTVEFGTVPFQQIALAIKEENQAHFYGGHGFTSDKYLQSPQKKAILETYHPNSEEFRVTVLERGKHVIESCIRLLTGSI